MFDPVNLQKSKSLLDPALPTIHMSVTIQPKNALLEQILSLIDYFSIPHSIILNILTELDQKSGAKIEDYPKDGTA